MQKLTVQQELTLLMHLLLIAKRNKINLTILFDSIKQGLYNEPCHFRAWTYLEKQINTKLQLDKI